MAAGVALRAGRGGVFASERELGLAVIEGGAQPVSGRVAQRTILREAGCDVIRIGGGLIFLEVAGITSGAESFVNSARMALHTSRRRVLAGEREGGLRGVVERSPSPIRGGVAELAILRESSRGMVRIGGALVVLQVARIASGAEAFVDSARMALDATRRRVLPSERECGLGSVIEFRSGPIDRSVALRAILREASSGMVRIGGALVVLQVAGIASGGQRGVLAAGMALSASRGGVCAGQRKFGGAVIKGGRHPCRGGVAELAILRESGGSVIRIGGALKIFQMARSAGGRRGPL